LGPSAPRLLSINGVWVVTYRTPAVGMTTISGKTTAAAYWLGNLTARYQIDRNLFVFARIENLFDESYQTA